MLKEMSKRFFYQMKLPVKLMEVREYRSTSTSLVFKLSVLQFALSFKLSILFTPNLRSSLCHIRWRFSCLGLFIQSFLYVLEKIIFTKLTPLWKVSLLNLCLSWTFIHADCSFKNSSSYSNFDCYLQTSLLNYIDASTLALKDSFIHYLNNLALYRQ